MVPNSSHVPLLSHADMWINLIFPPDPTLIDTGIGITNCQWNHDGTILAVAGKDMDYSAMDKESNVVQFYSNVGSLLRTLKVPGRDIAACTWEGGSLRIALAVDSFIYFANIRPNYKWTYFANVVAYSFLRAEKQESVLAFWNTNTNEVRIKNWGIQLVGSRYCPFHDCSCQ